MWLFSAQTVAKCRNFCDISPNYLPIRQYLLIFVAKYAQEALTAVSTAALTVYDMCKAVQKDMVITDIRLLSKTGGVHGDYKREEA